MICTCDFYALYSACLTVSRISYQTASKSVAAPLSEVFSVLDKPSVMPERSLNLKQSVHFFFFYQVKISFRTGELVIMCHHHNQSNISCHCKPRKASISVQDPWCINIGFSLLHTVKQGKSIFLYFSFFFLHISCLFVSTVNTRSWHGRDKEFLASCLPIGYSTSQKPGNTGTP